MTIASEAYNAKVCLLGDPAVGKTSLVRRFVLDQYSDEYLPTIGAKITKKYVAVSTDARTAEVSLMIWDINGQGDLSKDNMDQIEKFKPPSRYYSLTNGAIIVCDITKKETFAHMSMWYESLVTEIGFKVPSVLICNKSDLKGSAAVTDADLSDFSREMGFPFYYTSAKTGENVESVFLKLGEMLFKEMSRP